jgi:iron-sulfur cluster assembly protein/iron-sulfur cluster insertion protein
MSTTEIKLTDKNAATITLTDAAITKVADLIAAENVEEVLALRVAVKPGGCAGFNYDMYFDSDVNPDDTLHEFGAVRVVVDNDSAELLAGSTLDFQDGLQGAGFHINNPNASRGCGCGKSFS